MWNYSRDETEKTILGIIGNIIEEQTVTIQEIRQKITIMRNNR